MNPTVLEASSVMCAVVAAILTTMSVWLKFRYLARWIVCVPTMGAIFHGAWILDVLIKSRIDSVSYEALKAGEMAGFIWMGLGIAFFALAWLHHDIHGDADTHGEPCTQRAFESEKTRTAREMRKSGQCVAARR